MLIAVQKSTGALLASGGAQYYGSGRPDDEVSVRSSVPVAVRFYADDFVTRVLLDAATGVLSFIAQPAANDAFTVGETVYTAVSALTGAANQVLIGGNLAATIANLAGAINAASTGGQAAGATYGAGTVANSLAIATASTATTISLAAAAADYTGNAVVTATTSASASFGSGTLTNGDVLNLDIKPEGEYDADFTLPTPSFIAPANPAAGDYTGALQTNIVQAIALLEPNNPAAGLLTLTAQPAANATFTVGAVTYTAVAALTAANQVLLGANLAAFLANLIGAINGATTGGQSAGATYGTGTVANPLATAVQGAGNTVVITATPAASGVIVATSTTSDVASFGAAQLVYGTSSQVEPASADLMAQLSWGPSGAPPNRSQQWTISLDNSIRQGDEELPEDATPPYPPSAEVSAAIAQAASAAATLAGFPSGAALTAAVACAEALPIQPPAACAALLWQFLQFSYSISYSGTVTSIDLGLLAAWIQTTQEGIFPGYAGSISLYLTNAALTQEFVDESLATFAATLVGGSAVNINYSGGTSASPTHTNEIFTLDFTGFHLSAIKTAGTPVTYEGTGNIALVFDPTKTGAVGLSDSVVGLSDATTIAEVVALVLQLPGYIDATSTPTASGLVITVTDADESNYPYAGFGTDSTGIVSAEVQAGIVNASITTMQSNNPGSVFITN